jgi:hypothetical protein
VLRVPGPYAASRRFTPIAMPSKTFLRHTAWPTALGGR